MITKEEKREYDLIYCKKNKDIIKIKKQIKRIKTRNKLFEHYGYSCKWCGENDKNALQIDHIHNDGYIERKIMNYTSSDKLYRYIIKNNYPDKYQVLCASCNKTKMLNNGILLPSRKSKYKNLPVIDSGIKLEDLENKLKELQDKDKLSGK